MVTFHRHRGLRKPFRRAIGFIAFSFSILSFLILYISDLRIGYLGTPPKSELTYHHLLIEEQPANHPSQSEEEEANGSTLPYIRSGGCEAPRCTINFPKNLAKEAKSEQIDVISQAASTISGHCTLKGLKGGRTPNQDRSVLIETPHGFIAGLFDGHGTNGETSSSIAQKVLPALVLDAGLNIDGGADIMDDIFRKADSEVMQALGGTTAFVVFQQYDTVHVVWVGDSSAYLVHWLGGSKSSVYKTVLATAPHKPADPEERLRIESHGGHVVIPLNPIETSRVIYVETDSFGRQVEFGLAMSRSLGDKGGKLSKVLTAKPSMLSFNLPRSGDYFVVLASDGVRDVIPERELLSKLGNFMFSNHKQSFDEACEEIVFQASEAWEKETGGSYRDDISLLFRKVDFRSAIRP